jgi:hypothetical protein
MNNYKQMITELLKHELKNNNNNQFFLTIYFPVSRQNKKRAKLEFKSLFLKKFNSHPQLKNNNQLKEKVIDEVYTKISKLFDLEKSIAIFLHFNQKQIINLTLTALPYSLKREVFLTKAYNLDQLIQANYFVKDALILNLKIKTAKFHLLFDHKLKKLAEIENQHLTAKANEYLEKHSPTEKDSVLYGTGSNKTGRRKTKLTEYFLNDITGYVKNNKQFNKNFKYIIVFYTDNFRNIIGKHISQLKLYFPQAQIISVYKNITRRKSLKQDSQDLIKTSQKNQQKKLLELIKNSQEKYITNWQKIIKASRENRIRHLFIKLNTEKKGFLHKNQFIYLKKKAKTRAIKNIVPWLIKNTVDANGQVHIISQKSQLLKSNIAVYLRF